MSAAIKTPLDVDLYYRERGISPSTCEAFGAVPGNDGRSIRLREGTSGTVFRVLDGGACKWKAAAARECTEIHGPSDDFGKSVFIVEGLHDLMSLKECGVTNAVAIPSASTQANLLEVLKAKWKDPTLLLLFDRDEAGDRATVKALEVLQEAGYARVFDVRDCVGLATNGATDVNEVLVAQGSVHLSERLKIASCIEERQKHVESFGAVRHIAEIIEHERTGKNNPAKTGISAFDDALGGGLTPGCLYVLGAISSLGKTTFALYMAVEAAKAGRHVLFVTIEQSGAELVRKIVGMIYTSAIVPTSAVGPMLAKDHSAKTKEHMEEVDRVCSSFFTVEPSGPITVSDIDYIARKHIRVTGVTPIIFIDYLQIIGRPDSMSGSVSDKQVTDINVTALRQAARDLHTPIFVVSSLNRASYKEPVTMSAFKESGAIEYGADVLLGLHLAALDDHRGEKELDHIVAEAKKAVPRHVVLSVLKNRNGSIPDGIRLVFDPRTSRFNEQGESSSKPLPSGWNFAPLECVGGAPF